jgi:hypothetical protein
MLASLVDGSRARLALFQTLRDEAPEFRGAGLSEHFRWTARLVNETFVHEDSRRCRPVGEANLAGDEHPAYYY